MTLQRQQRLATLVATAAMTIFIYGCGSDDGGGRVGDAAAPAVDQGAPAVDQGSPSDGATGDMASDGSAGKAVEEVNCSSVTPDREAAMEGTAFQPAAITVGVGQIVRWTNKDGVPHTVTSGRSGDADAGAAFDSGNLSKGASYCLRFNDKGAYDYWCRVHPGSMNDGVVTVQ